MNARRLTLAGTAALALAAPTVAQQRPAAEPLLHPRANAPQEIEMTTRSKTQADLKRAKSFVIRHFDDLVNNKDLSVVERNFAPGYVDHDGPSGTAANVAEGRRRVATMFERVPDLRVELRDVIAEGDRVVVRAVWSGTNRDTGKRVEFHGFVLWRLEDGKLAERWATLTPPSALTTENLNW